MAPTEDSGFAIDLQWNLGATRKMTALLELRPKAFYPEATALVKTLIISHHLFIFSDILPRQNLLILWDIVSDNGTGKRKQGYVLNVLSSAFSH